MQKDPYLVLGLKEGASEEEVREAYARLKAQYSSDRFLEGESGMAATRKLSELEQAYNDCIDDIKKKSTTETYGSKFGAIEREIKSGNYDNAQRMLDDIDARDAEWHYYQSMIYFKKGWHMESKKQLELCIALEPANDKYNTALNKMNEYIKNNSNPYAAQNAGANNGQQQQQQQRAGYSDRNPNAANNADACCNSCCTLLCCDSCCECMGGDLIPCC